VRLALSSDTERASATLARAFEDDPMVSWMIHGEVTAELTVQKTLERVADGFFEPSVTMGRQRGHTYLVEDRGALKGVAVWTPPEATVFDEAGRDALVAAMAEHLGGDALLRTGSLGDLCREHHPTERPHFYLFLVGVDPRGQGWGLPLLEPVLARCDADGLGAYLESSNARNLDFYRRLGFQTAWQDRPESSGPLMTGMWRDPR